MSRVEEQALEAYPRELDNWCESNVDRRIGYRQGYEQAIKDLMADAIETTIDGKVVKVIVIDEYVKQSEKP